jgi:hypothetical protein
LDWLGVEFHDFFLQLFQSRILSRNVNWLTHVFYFSVVFLDLIFFKHGKPHWDSYSIRSCNVNVNLICILNLVLIFLLLFFFYFLIEFVFQFCPSTFYFIFMYNLVLIFLITICFVSYYFLIDYFFNSIPQHFIDWGFNFVIFIGLSSIRLVIVS